MGRRLRPRIEVSFVTMAADDARVEAAAATLSAEERARATRLAHPRDRRRFVVSHAALRSALASRTGIEANAVELDRGPCGKPRLRHPRWLEFSMSRAGEVAAFAFAAEPVGIDLVAVESGERLLEAAQEFCSPEEHGTISRFSRAAQIDALLRIWARKEALLKATGEGFLRAPATLSVWREASRCQVRVGNRAWALSDLAAPAGYRAALAHPSG